MNNNTNNHGPAEQDEIPYFQRVSRRNREVRELHTLSTASDGFNESEFERAFGKLLAKRLADWDIKVTSHEVADFRKTHTSKDNPWMQVSINVPTDRRVIDLHRIASAAKSLFPPHSDIEVNFVQIMAFEQLTVIKFHIEVLALFANYDDRAAYNKKIRDLRKEVR